MGFASRGARRIQRIWEKLYFYHAIRPGEYHEILFSIACTIGLISLWVVTWLGVTFLDLRFGAFDMSMILFFPVVLGLCNLTLLFISGPGKGLGGWIFYMTFSVFVYFLYAILFLQILIIAVVAASLLVSINILDFVLATVVISLHFIILLIALIVYALFLVVSPGFLWSRWLVIRPPRCRAPGPVCEAYCKSSRNSLCGRCTSLIRESALITGTPFIFTNPVETHDHHTQRGLLQSATYCHLCSLLKDSAGTSETGPVDSRPTSHGSSPQSGKDLSGASTTPLLDSRLASYGSTSQSRADSSPSVVVSQTRRAGFPAVLQIRNDPEKFPDSPGLHIQRVYSLKRSQHQCSDSWETPAFGLAKKWIQSCTKHHSRCRKAQPHIDLTFRPTRLIKVTSPSSASLVETITEERLHYLALSHCWGKATIVTLDSPERLEAWKIFLPVQELSKNFQDAIRITFGLGFEYLWIDSICIIQGNELDWEKESARMGHVYANAACTISATVSENAQDGFFFSREPFKSECIIGVDCFSSLVATPASSQSGPREVFETKVEKAPLTTRAWTFQERILSKRVLHFSKDVLLFECSTMLATEYHNEGVPYNSSITRGLLPRRVLIKALYYQERLIALITNNIKVLFRLNLMRPIAKAFFYLFCQCAELIDILNGNNGDDIRRIMAEFTYSRSFLMYPVYLSQKHDLTEMRTAFQAVGNHPRRKWDLEENLEFHQQWFELVGPYSARDLTNHTDRLVAITGVATFIQERTGSQFLAGLWRTSLAWDLLWNCEKPNSERRRSTLLPTWSWASVDGAIQHEFTLDKASARQTTPNDRRLEDIVFFIKPENWVIKVIKEQSDIIQNAALLIDKCLLVELQDKDEFLPDVELDRKSERLFMMPIVGIYHGSEKFKDKGFWGVLRPASKLHRKVYGILLQNLATQPDAFERVGYFSALEAPILERALIDAPSTPDPEMDFAPHEMIEENYRWRSSIRIQ